MLENFVTDKFEYKKLSESEQKARRILGRLTGVIAETKKPTRNGRGYSIELWENVFENPIMKEKIANRCCFGELNHPADRTEIDIEKVAICLAEQPKKSTDGRLYGVFDILDTPNGRILKTLCDYGCKIGISSRGQGDIITDRNGDDMVDPETYECECFDAVLIPGVEAARLTYVTESLNNKKSLKQTLTESLDAASEDEKVIMKETLENLNLMLEAKDEDDEVVDTEEVAADVEADADVEPTADDSDSSVEATETEASDLEAELADDEIDDIVDIEDEDEEEIPTATPDDVDDIELELVDDSTDEEEMTDEEIFLHFLSTNFDEEQIKEVCKILDIEVEDVEAEETEDSTDENSEDAADEVAAEDETDTDDAEVSDDEIVDDESTEEVEETSDEDINSDEEDAEQDEEPVEEAIDDGASALVNTLKETLKAKSDLENDVKSLQEKLAVSDAKVDALNEECGRYKVSISRLSQLAKSSKDLTSKVSALEESLAEKDEVISSQKLRISRLIESKKQSANAANEVTTLTESLNTTKTSYEEKINGLTESLNREKQEAQSKITELTESVKKTTAIKESYRTLANKAVNKYIEVKADTLGLTPKDIKRKLGESYTLEDVDQVCEDLKSYQLNVSRLPFSVDRKVSVKVNESMSTRKMTSNQSMFDDDDIDGSLIRLANLD